METKQLLHKLIQTPGVSGFEHLIQKTLIEYWTPITNEISISKLGSVHGIKFGSAHSRRKKIMIATHMDTIGLIITKIDERGQIFFSSIGGIDPRVLPGTPVTIHGSKVVPGIIVIPPTHTLRRPNNTSAVTLQNLRIDTALTKTELLRLVSIGDPISFATEARDIDGDVIVGHSLDNRASVTVMTKTFELLQSRIHKWDVIGVATVQEETTLAGASTSGYQLEPELAVVIDVTFGKGPGTPSQKAYDLNKGPTFDWGPHTHPHLYKAFEDMAKSNEFAFQRSVYHRSSGTDAISLQLAHKGIPTMILGIPLRYMHTPVEMVQLKDINRCARILSEFISNLDDDKFEDIISNSSLNEVSK